MFILRKHLIWYIEPILRDNLLATEFIWSSLAHNISWSAVSKTFESSKKQAILNGLSSLAFNNFSNKEITASGVEW